MGKFSESIKAVAKVKNHPAGLAAKIEVRRKVLTAIGASEARVFDAFSGDGEMYRSVWREAVHYVGCDLDWHRDERCAYVCDNRRVLRAIDLSQVTIFDLDSFGSPWEQAIIVAARRIVQSGERIGLVLTEGSGLYLKQGGLPRAIVELTGLKSRMPGLGRWQGDVIDRALAGLADRMNCRLEKRWEAHRTPGAAVRYIGMVLVGLRGDE